MRKVERAVSPWRQSTPTSRGGSPPAPVGGAHGLITHRRADDGSVREWRAQKREGPRPIRRHADLRVSLLGSRATTKLHLLSPIFNRFPTAGGGHEAAVGAE